MNPVTNFYYSKSLPDQAVALMKVRATPVTPANYVDKLNVLAASGQIGPGSLDARAWPVEAHYFAPVELGEVLTVNDDPVNTGESYQYTVKNQFIEVTNKWDEQGTYFYFHPVPSGISEITITNNDGETVAATYLLEGNRLYHTLDGAIYWIKYFHNEQFHRELLTYQLVVPRAARRDVPAPSVPAGTFGWTHGVIDLPDRTAYRFRWYEDNRFRILDPYTTLPNDPWYMRVRHNMAPQPPEWARMRFSPYRPFMTATWVPGALVADNVIEFERKRILFDGKKYPDVLIFNKDFELKWALDGNAVDSPEKQGYVYPWTRSRLLQCDARNGRVRVSVDVAPDDIIYGFYFYEELDLIYTALDVNPFTNPPIRNKTVELVHIIHPEHPERHVWHKVYDHQGQLIAELSQLP